MGEKIAFAIGGLGGNNAWGAGFLQAALDRRICPDMISCTSGQIYWVSLYFDALRKQRDPEQSGPTENYLRKELQHFIDNTEITHVRDLDMMTLAIQGKPGMMRVAFPEMIFDTMKNGLKTLEGLFREGEKNSG